MSGTQTGGTGSSGRRQVAVLGAGPSGLAAAFALTKTGRFDVHVYQMGWRAGGKCATGRDQSDYRSLQNGSHYLFGCYHNSFSLIRQAYAVLGSSDDPDKECFGRLEEEFESRNLLVGVQRYRRDPDVVPVDGAPWYRYMPQNMASPGDDAKLPTKFDWAIIIFQFALGFGIDLCALLLSSIYNGLFFRHSGPERFVGLRVCLWLFPLDPFDRSLRARLMRAPLWPIRWLFNGFFWLLSKVLHAFSYITVLLLPARLRAGFRRTFSWIGNRLLWFVRASTKWLLLASLRLPTTGSNAVQRSLILSDLAVTLLVGYFRDGLNRPGGFERIDREDFKAWLTRHGAHEDTVESSLITTWYDAVISYKNGDKEHPECSAGVAVQSMLRALLTYKGAFAYQMRAEVGDSFIAPVVKALETLGVQFHFYTRVKHVVVSPEARRVKRIELDVQCEHHGLGAEFMNVKDRRFPKRERRKSWPAKPLHCEACAALDPALDSYYSAHYVAKRTLLAREEAPAGTGEVFDLVVAALPLGMMEDVLVREKHPSERLAEGEDTRPGADAETANELISVADTEPAWKDCFGHVRHTESQALRIWFKVPLQPAGGRSLGWTQSPPILSGYRWPFNTWEDNSQATHIQNFGPNEEAKSIATVFGPLQTGEGSIRELRHFERQRQVAESSAWNFVVSNMVPLWPGLKNEGAEYGVDWNSFVDLENRSGPKRFNWQHVATNVGPLESYVQAAPNTLQYRLRADESQFSNLFLAGDWIRNGIEVGSVEGAVISGLKAARMIAGESVRIVGGDDFDCGTLFVNGV